MHMISAFPDSSAGLAIAVLSAAVAVLARAITRIMLCALAASATRKALEDPADSHADSHADRDALRAHRLAVLQAILATLSVHGIAEASKDDTRLVLPAQHSPRSPKSVQSTSGISADVFEN